MSYTTRTPVTSTYWTRDVISSSYSVRQWVSSDLWYLETQLGFLCDNSWNTILFHTGTFYATNTPYSVRPII
jgi:hypothetical protein